MQIFTQHFYVQKTILTDLGSTFTSQMFNRLMESAGMKIKYATVKHARTIGMVDCSHQKLKQILTINISTDSPQWHKYVNMAVLADNTTYQQARHCTSIEFFYGQISFNALDIWFGNPLHDPRNRNDVNGILSHMINKTPRNSHHRCRSLSQLQKLLRPKSTSLSSESQ